MKKKLLLSVCLLVAVLASAQRKDFTYNFYGQVRTDLYYNSRLNQESIDGLFNLFPLEIESVSNGKDVNSVSNSDFCTLYSRLGVDVTGPKLMNVETSAKVEVDFSGSGSYYSIARIRHAYLSLDWWGKSTLLMGQTWHPLFGDVSPQIVNLSAGAPFQPYSLAPQIRYQYTNGIIRLTAAAVWQSQFTSIGPENVSSRDYLKNGCIPEFYVGADFKSGGWFAGVGMELLSIRPRTEAWGYLGKCKVNERVTTLSYEAHVKYSNEDWFVGAKSVVGRNLTQMSMLGGYGVEKISKSTGLQEYRSLLHSSSWLNVVYGKKWKPGIFVGYIKKLNANAPEISVTGMGTDIKQLMRTGVELTYNVKHWKFGLEYNFTSAWYESMLGYLISGGKKTVATHPVSNHHVMGAAIFMF